MTVTTFVAIIALVLTFSIIEEIILVGGVVSLFRRIRSRRARKLAMA